MPEPTPPTPAAALLARGQALETDGTPADFAAALRCYDTALALLRSAPATPSLDLAVAWMNRGNVLQQLAPPDFPAALAAYDTAVALLRAAPDTDLVARNSLGAAWMNRGLAAHRLATPESILDAVRSHAEAIVVLGALPLAANSVFPRNLAAALLNQANALLDTARPELFAAALAAARSAIELTAPSATTACAWATCQLAQAAWWSCALSRAHCPPQAQRACSSCPGTCCTATPPSGACCPAWTLLTLLALWPSRTMVCNDW